MERVSVAEVLGKVKEILGEIDKNVDLLNLFNIVEAELVSEVIKLTDTITTKLNDDSEILVSQFPKRLLSIIDIYHNNEKIGWGYHFDSPGTGIHVPGYSGKEVTIEYHYVPDAKDEDSESDLPMGLIDILVYGVITEYFLVKGEFEQASWYDRKYKKILYGRDKKKLLKKWERFING